MNIRPALALDIPAIAGIYAHAVATGTASWEYDAPDEAEMARRLAVLAEGGFPWLVAEATDAATPPRLLGYAYAGPYRSRAGYRWTVEDSVYIAPDAQGAGVGRALLSELIAICTRRGWRQMVAVIGDSSSLASIALHRSLGFREAGLIRSAGWKNGRWLDQMLMQRALGEGDDAPPQED